MKPTKLLLLSADTENKDAGPAAQQTQVPWQTKHQGKSEAMSKSPRMRKKL